MRQRALSCLQVQHWGNWDGFCSATLLSVRRKPNHIKAQGQHLHGAEGDMQQHLGGDSKRVLGSIYPNERLLDI